VQFFIKIASDKACVDHLLILCLAVRPTIRC